MFCNANTLGKKSQTKRGKKMGESYLLNDVGTELLNRKSANVAGELPDHGITEPIIV
jgi:hypothetical protein